MAALVLYVVGRKRCRYVEICENPGVMNRNEKVLQRWVLTIAYHGGGLHGWQKQKDGSLSVQSILEEALGAVAGEPVQTVAAGRTDAGVHATAQVVHFDTSAQRLPEAWVRGGNSAMDKRVRIVAAQPVVPDFHARFNACGRRYRYVLESSRVRTPHLRGIAGWTHRSLDMEAVRAAAVCLPGQHDFSSFRAAECQAKSPVKDMYSVSISGSAELMAIDLHGSAFLHHMVRNIVGALVYVGAGMISVDDFAALLPAKDRTKAPPTFMADGLYLTGVDYPEHLHLPVPPLPAWLWPHLQQ